jgi:hypothetical protein
MEITAGRLHVCRDNFNYERTLLRLFDSIRIVNYELELAIAVTGYLIIKY